MNRKGMLFILVVFFGLVACDSQKNYVPKPPTYLQFNLPERKYEIYTDSCGYSFNKPGYFDVQANAISKCNRDIELSDLNGILYLSRIDMDTSLAVYINHALNKVEEHKVKATAIFDSTIIRSDSRVFGTFFELQGNVASPLQFYLTDSTSRFISGTVYFNVRPNYDSIKPVLNFVKKDILMMMNSLEWNEH